MRDPSRSSRKGDAMPHKGSYTMGTQEMIEHMVTELPDKYLMELNQSDMETLIWGLGAHVGFVTPDDAMQDRISSLFSSIAETLEIEGI
jgi:hypothetical protein